MRAIGDFEEFVKRKGRIEGIQEGVKQSIIKLLDKGFSEEEIIDLLEVNKKIVMKAKKEIREE